MRTPRNNKIVVKHRGQALTELAIFGSILLFCLAMLIQYALEANYRQQAQMEAFRKAQKIAFYKQGPASSTSLLLLKDKPLVDPGDKWGFAERTPIIGSGNAVWDTNLSAGYVKSFAGMPSEDDLPAMYFEIDKGDLAKVKGTARASVPSEAGEDNVFGLHMAAFKKIPCPAVVIVEFADPDHSQGTEYIKVGVPRDAIKVMNLEIATTVDDDTHLEQDPEVHGVVGDDEELLMHPYFRYKGMKYKITLADVDGDGKLENVIAANKNKELFYIDSHDGYSDTPASGETLVAGEIQIDEDRTSVYPWDEEGKAKIEDRQGLIQDFKKTIKHQESKIVKTEGDINPNTELHATQEITHYIRLNNGTVLEIPATFTVDKNKLYNWD